MCTRTRWWINILLICYLFQTSVQDCIQNENGFQDLPTGSATVSDPNYSAGGLQTYYNIVIGFIDTVLPEGYQGWKACRCMYTCVYVRCVIVHVLVWHTKMYLKNNNKKTNLLVHHYTCWYDFDIDIVRTVLPTLLGGGFSATGAGNIQSRVTQVSIWVLRA